MAKKEDSLGPYRGKRDFERTPEPPGGGKRRSRTQPRFVVHKHDATTLHLRLPLEGGGALKSGQDGRRADRRPAQASQEPTGVSGLGANHRGGRRGGPGRQGSEGIGSAGGREPSWPARCGPLSATGGSPIRDGSYTTPPGRHPRACVGAAFSAHVALERASARETGHLSMTPQEVGPVMRCPSGVPAPRTGSDVVLTSV
jgi:hypothetical protein